MGNSSLLCNQHCVNIFCFITRCYTYIIGHYNPSVRIIDLVSHTTYVVCFNFIHQWRDLQFKVDSERQIFWEIFHGNFICILRVFVRNLLRGNRRRNNFRISFWCLAWDSNPGFSSNKPADYLLDHGDFKPYFFKFYRILADLWKAFFGIGIDFILKTSEVPAGTLKVSEKK